MDPKDVCCPLKWDRERLGDLADPLHERGADICKEVIREICPDLTKGQSVNSLATNLYSRKVLNEEDYLALLQPTANGIMLTRSLFEASLELRGRGKHLVMNLYLSLLDVFLDSCDQWCHNIALHKLRETAVKQLGLSPLPSAQEIDLKEVSARFPPVILPSSSASQLRRNLRLPSRNEEITNLKSILDEYSRIPDLQPSLRVLVTAMMKTQGVGRYVSNLLPFHQSYPLEVLVFLEKLGKHWEEFALFLGFTREDVGTLHESSHHDTRQEIKNFSKVWRMPDFKKRINDEILYGALQMANIRLDERSSTVDAANSPNLNLQISISSERNGRFTTQVSQNSGDSSRANSQRGSLRRMGSGHHRHLQELRNMQGSDSSDLSIDSGHSPLVRQNSRRSAADSDMDMSVSSLVLYQRQSSDLPEESEPPVSPHPTSSKPVASSPHAPSPYSLSSHISPHPPSQPTSSHPTSSQPTSSQPTSPHPTSSQAVQSGSDTKKQKEEVIAPSLGKLHRGSTDSCPTEDIGSLQDHSDKVQTFSPDDEVTLVDKTRNLGIGLYGEIFEVKHRGEKYAAKEYRNGLITPEELKRRFTEGLIGLKHTNIVPYYGVCTISGSACLVVVMERLHSNLATLFEDMNKKQEKDLEPPRKLSILCDVAGGLAYLHSRGIVHSDLVPRNVLLTSELTAKIADYGNARVKEMVNIEGRPTDAIRFDYLPPEVMCMEGSEHKYDDKVDVFSFGHLSIYIVLQEQPHPLANPTYRINGKPKARSELERRQKFIDRMKLKISGNVLQPLLEWTKKCLDDEAENRPRITDLKLDRTHN